MERITKTDNGVKIETVLFTDKVDGEEVITDTKYYSQPELDIAIERIAEKKEECDAQIASLNEVKSVLEKE